MANGWPLSRRASLPGWRLAARCAVLLAVGVAMPAASSAPLESVLRVRHPSLSADGRTLAFSYQGDIWTVAAEGGRATRLTSHPARDVQPVISPDGRTIAFASNRSGNFDVYLMPTTGGPPRQLTFHSGAEFANSFTPDGQWLIFHANTYGALDLYKVRVAGGEPIRLTWDLYERKYFGNVSPDGQWIAFNHNGAPGDWRRRGYEGSANADIWLARFTTPVGEPKRLTTNPAHDFMPLFSRDGRRLYYASDRKGQVNIWSMELAGGAQKQLTFHTSDGVRIPSYAPQAEKIAYEYASGIWILDLRSGKTAPVPIEAVSDVRRNLDVERTVNANPTEYTISPDGKKAALIVRGDLVVIPATGGTARVLIGRASRESHIAWMPDSRRVLFCTDVRGQKDLHVVDITGQNERALADSPEDETNPLVSPDGKLLAFHRGDKALVVQPLEGGAPVATIAGDFADVGRGYTPFFSWSPDSQWLAFKQTGEKLQDSIHVASLADPRPRRVSHFFRDTGAPRWAPNARLLYFTGVAVDRSNLYAIDLADEEEPAFEEDAIDRLDNPAPRRAPGPPTVRIDFAAVDRRLRRVTAGAPVADALMSPNSASFLVQSGRNLFTVPAAARDATGTLLVENAVAPEITRDGSRIYFLSSGELQSIGMPLRDRRTSTFTATLRVNQVSENRQVFEEAWWLMDRYFYAETLNNVDWRAIRARYEALLPYAIYKDDFYEMMEEMIQELRGSHLGVSGPPEYSAESPARTGYLGFEPDWGTLEREGRIRVARVVRDSPADTSWSKLNPGDYVLAIDGKELGKDGTMAELLNRKDGRKVVLTVNSTPTLEGARQVAIRPVTPQRGDDLEYEDWVGQRARMAEQLSGGRVVYLHIRRMNPESEERFKEEFVGHATGKEALLVDVRYNGGGNVAHRLLDILRKRAYVTFRPRSLGKVVLSDWFGDYLWGKPAALLINQDSASNSEMMAEGFRALGIGPLVGTPTRGAVIATGTWTFLDGGSIRLPSSGVYTADGEDMELRGRQPDVLVPYDPLPALVQLLLSGQAAPRAGAAAPRAGAGAPRAGNGGQAPR
jgi:tricorn protease